MVFKLKDKQQPDRPRIGGGFVPAPPPVVPSFSMSGPMSFMGMAPYAQMAAPQQAPQQAVPPTANVQEQPVNPMLMYQAPDPAILKDYQAAGQPIKDNLDSLTKQVADWKPTAAIQSPEQSPMENMLQQAYGQRIGDLLQKGSSAGDRWDTGFARGSKIASAVLGPLIGGFAGADGKTLMETVNAIGNQSDQTIASQRQKREQDNLMLANMAQAYENLDPKSAKNLLALSKERLLQQREDRLELNELKGRQQQALSSWLTHQKGLAELSRGVAKDNNKIVNDKVNQGRNDVLADSTLRKNEASIQEGEARTQMAENADHRADESLGLRKNADGRAQQQLILNQKADKRASEKQSTMEANHRENFNFQKMKAMTGARENLMRLTQGIYKEASAVDAFGRPKHGDDYIKNYINQKGVKTLLKSQMAAAGQAGDVEDLFGLSAAQPSAKKSDNSDLGGMIAGALGMAPPKQDYKSHEEAIAAFQEKFGRMPADATELKKGLGIK